MSIEIPVRMTNPAAFAALRRFLEASGYSEAFLLEHFGAVSLHELLFAGGARQQAFAERYRGDSLVLFLARLLFGGIAASEEELRRYLPDEIETALGETGLLDGQRRCPVLLHPALGLFVASDRKDYAGADFVMSGSEGLCRLFLRFIGTSPCGTFLDMGTGAGIAAMLASRYAREVWAVDIVERAVRYAKWNCALNGVENVTVLQGDLFEPVRGMRFDRIASNPPFEPSLTGDAVFSCGGEDGEAILARLIAETPRHLAPGGRLYCQVEGTDRANESLDERIVRWLGNEAGAHDTALFVRDTYDPLDFASQQVVHSNQDAATMERWTELYGKLQARAVTMGHLIVQRHEASREGFHRRAKFHPDATIADLERCVDEAAYIASSAMEEIRPAPGAGWELHVRHRPQGGDLRPLSYTFVTESPLQGEWSVPAWVARIVSRTDGAITAERHARWAEANAGVRAQECYSWLRLLLWAGVLVLPVQEDS